MQDNDAPHDATPYVIWSFEHDAWWRPGRMGYTKQLAHAGHYSQTEAEQIAADANRYAKEIHQQAMPLHRAQEYTRRCWHPLSPGAYDDRQGGLHLVLPEMLAAFGYADTHENRETLMTVAQELAAGAPVHVEEE